MKFLRHIVYLHNFHYRVCDLTYFSRLQTACPQPLSGNELLKTCNVILHCCIPFSGAHSSYTVLTLYTTSQQTERTQSTRSRHLKPCHFEEKKPLTFEIMAA
jgi:hypothetical protein